MLVTSPTMKTPKYGLSYFRRKELIKRRCLKERVGGAHYFLMIGHLLDSRRLVPTQKLFIRTNATPTKPPIKPIIFQKNI